MTTTSTEIRTDNLSNIFNRHGDYCTVEQCAITSTVFKLGSGEYCIHCCKKAATVQGGLSKLNKRTEFEHYETTGYRCNCDAALDEIVEKMATLHVTRALGRQCSIEPKKYGIKREHYLRVLASMGDSRLPLWGEGVSSITPRIASPSPSSYASFFNENQLELAMHLKDDRYLHLPLVQLVRAIERKAGELMGVERKKAQEELELINSVNLNVQTGH